MTIGFIPLYSPKFICHLTFVLFPMTITAPLARRLGCPAGRRVGRERASEGEPNSLGP